MVCCFGDPSVTCHERDLSRQQGASRNHRPRPACARGWCSSSPVFFAAGTYRNDVCLDLVSLLSMTASFPIEEEAVWGPPPVPSLTRRGGQAAHRPHRDGDRRARRDGAACRHGGCPGAPAAKRRPKENKVARRRIASRYAAPRAATACTTARVRGGENLTRAGAKGLAAVPCAEAATARTRSGRRSRGR